MEFKIWETDHVIVAAKGGVAWQQNKDDMFPIVDPYSVVCDCCISQTIKDELKELGIIAGQQYFTADEVTPPTEEEWREIKELLEKDKEKIATASQILISTPYLDALDIKEFMKKNSYLPLTLAEAESYAANHPDVSAVVPECFLPKNDYLVGIYKGRITGAGSSFFFKGSIFLVKKI